MIIFGQTTIKMNIPQNLKFTKDHEWVLIEGDIATVKAMLTKTGATEINEKDA